MNDILTNTIEPQSPKNFKKNGYKTLPSHPPSRNFKTKIFFIKENNTEDSVTETTAKTKSIFVLNVVDVIKQSIPNQNKITGTK